MSEEKVTATLTGILTPCIGPYLAELAARHLWDTFERCGLDDLLEDLVSDYPPDNLAELLK